MIGSDAIQWLVDNVEGLSSVEAAQVPYHDTKALF